MKYVTTLNINVLLHSTFNQTISSDQYHSPNKIFNGFQNAHWNGMFLYHGNNFLTHCQYLISNILNKLVQNAPKYTVLK
jgi:hypothetical protein